MRLGAVDASDVAVAFYAGDLSQGGTVLHQEVVAGPIAAGASVTMDFTIAPVPLGQTVTIWGVADPANAIAECNDGNNADAADTTALCQVN